MISRISTTLLLTRHILRTMSSHVLRSSIVWLSLAASLAVIVGVFSFTQSIDDSYKARGDAVKGVADVQIQAVQNTHFDEDLPSQLEDVRGTKLAVGLDEQRIAIRSDKTISTVATAFGIDNEAKRLQSDLQRELNVRTPKDPEKGGLTISREMAAKLGVKRGDKVRVLAYSRSPLIKIRRVQTVAPALSEVVALPRKSVELLRGEKGPNTIYVQLDNHLSVAKWRERATDVLPDNAFVVTASDQQHQLNQVLNVTTRSYTYLFGAVALLIVALLVYVLQLMRMMDRQEDAGLVRALGSNSLPLAAAELFVLLLLVLAALPLGVLGGRAFAHQLAGNLPDYLTQVFNFTMVVKVHLSIVLAAMGATMLVAAVATVGALVATRRPVADQLGRSPQSGATAVAPISLPAALLITGAGFACMAIAGTMIHDKKFIATSLFALVGICLVAPGIAALFTHAIARASATGGLALLIARSAVEANPRRVAISAAIMALAVSAVVPLQLLDHAMAKRASDMTSIHRPEIQRIAASSDLFTTVPVKQEYLRKAIEEKAFKPKVKQPTMRPGMTPQQFAKAKRKAVLAARAEELRRPLPEYAAPFVMGFSTYRDQKIGVMALDARRAWPFKKRPGDTVNRNNAVALRKNRSQVVISTQLASWTGLKPGDTLRLRTADGIRGTKISSIVDDMSWPMGTVYFDLKRHRELFGRTAVNALIVKPSKVDREALKDLRPLHTYSGAELVARIQGQMDKVRDNMLAMRWMIVLASLVALAGILATSVLARRREWGVLRAVGTGQSRLLLALAIEIAVILLIGAVIGAIGGVITYEGPILAFLDDQGFTLSREIVAMPLLITAVSAIGIGLVAVMLSAFMVSRAKLTEALSYE